MNEARFSANVRFSFKGFETQFTMRDDENCNELLSKFTTVLNHLEKLGATPQVKNGTSKTSSGAADLTPSACKECGRSDNMELISFEKDGKAKKAWKCQTCQKWHS